MTVFAILGVQLFSGRFATCVDQPQLLSRADCLGAGATWKNPRMGHFDDFASAMLMLFECATFEGWPDVMFAAIDATNQVRPSSDHCELATHVCQAGAQRPTPNAQRPTPNAHPAPNIATLAAPPGCRPPQLPVTCRYMP